VTSAVKPAPENSSAKASAMAQLHREDGRGRRQAHRVGEDGRLAGSGPYSSQPGLVRQPAEMPRRSIEKRPIHPLPSLLHDPLVSARRRFLPAERRRAAARSLG
jgi:hypothetical protein